MNFGGGESGGDLGGRPNVSDIHQNLTPEEADEIGKSKRAGNSWGSEGRPQTRGKGRTKQIKSSITVA